MNALLKAELRKVRATATIWWLLLGTEGLGVIGTIGPLLAAKDDANLMTDRSLQAAMHGAAAGAILVIVAGIIGTAGEWRSGQAAQTFLTVPRRWRVVAAKGLAYMAVGVVYGSAAAAAALATAWGWYRTEGLAFPFERSDVWLTVLGCLAVAVLFGLVGVAVGAAVRNQVTAIVAAVGWLAVVEPGLFSRGMARPYGAGARKWWIPRALPRFARRGNHEHAYSGWFVEAGIREFVTPPSCCCPHRELRGGDGQALHTSSGHRRAGHGPDRLQALGTGRPQRAPVMAGHGAVQIRPRSAAALHTAVFEPTEGPDG